LTKPPNESKPPTKITTMNKTTTTLLAGALLFGAAASLNAQTPPLRQPFGTGELPEFLKPYDLDGDGKLSTEERQAFEKACREAKPPRPGAKNPWDTDGDGKLSDAEKQAARDAIAAKIAEQRTKRFNELDADQDGKVTAEELKAIPRITDEAIARMILHLDTDKDGSISLDEFTAVLKPVAPPVPPFPLPQPLPNPLPRGGLFIPRILASFDLDKDFRLNADELAAMKAALDTNADGKISADEWKAYVVAHPEILPPPPTPPTGPTEPGTGTSGR
jgi:Ca2+-binding EF-hand superfamily protein